LVVVAANCPSDYIDYLRAKHPEVTVHQAHIVNRDLGVACGKPFSISTLCVVDAGDSELLQLDDNMS
jgi:large subunit ribosomal protein L30e